jgi:hypothetical protein
VAQDVDEQEDEHADREHGQGDPGPGADKLETRDRQPQVDREAGQGS